MEKNYIHKIDDIINLANHESYPLTWFERIELHKLAWAAQSEIWELTKSNKELKEQLIAKNKEISALKRGKPLDN